MCSYRCGFCSFAKGDLPPRAGRGGEESDAAVVVAAAPGRDAPYDLALELSEARASTCPPAYFFFLPASRLIDLLPRSPTSLDFCRGRGKAKRTASVVTNLETRRQVGRRAAEAAARGATEVCMQVRGAFFSVEQRSRLELVFGGTLSWRDGGLHAGAWYSAHQGGARVLIFL